MKPTDGEYLSFQFQIRDAIKAVRIEATKAYNQYVEEPKTSQRRGRFDLELESDMCTIPADWLQ